MPFHDNVYYPFEQDSAHVSPILNTPWTPRSFTSPTMPSSVHGPLLKFRSRHECVDWRRIGAIDVDRVANELDFQTLQENIMNVTFCSVENEKCPRCHSSLDPVLIKLIRLTQYTIEYLLHSQEYLTSNLHTLEEKVRVAVNESDQMQIKVTKQTAEIKSLKDQCKLRKKMIAAQQMMISANAGTYHKCQHCEKSFVNYSYLENHIKRRHADNPASGANEKQTPQPFDNLHHEINLLKEELQLTKKQLESEKEAHLEKLSQLQESEQRKTMELDMMRTFDKWKAEERETFEEEMKKVREMFMKELKELTDKNSLLENELLEMKRQSLHKRSGLGTLEESPQTDRGERRSKCHHDIENVKELLQKQEEKLRKCIHELKQDHELDKKQAMQLLQQQHDQEKKKAIQLLQQQHERERNQAMQLVQQEFEREKNQALHRLQQEHENEKREKSQVKELSTKPPPSVKKTESIPGSSWQHIERRNSALASSTRDLDVEEEQPPMKYHIRDMVKNDHSLKKALRKILEEGLEEKLGYLGVKEGSRGIPSDKFQKVMDSRESNRHFKEKSFPGILKIHENFARHVTQKAEEQLLMSSKCAFSSQLFTDAKSATQGSTSSSPPRQRKQKPSLKSAQEELQPRYPVPVKSSTPKVKLVSSKEVSVKKPSSIGTPPFTSDDESEAENLPLQSFKHTNSLRSSGKGAVAFVASESDPEGSLLEEIKPQPAKRSHFESLAPSKPARATHVKEIGQQPSVTWSSGLADLNRGGGSDVTQEAVKKDPVMELKLTDLDDTEFDSSSVEEEPYEVPRSVKTRQEATIQKKQAPPISVRNHRGVNKLFKADAHEADTSSTLVSVSDFSDTSDI